MTQEEKDIVIKNIRGLLVSSKFPVLLQELQNDYLLTVGEDINFSKYGFDSLLHFLRSHTNSLKVSIINGETFLQAVLRQESEHIVKMKMREKPQKKKRPRTRNSNKGLVNRLKVSLNQGTNQRPAHAITQNQQTYNIERLTVSDLINNSGTNVEAIPGCSHTSNKAVPAVKSKSRNVNRRFRRRNKINSSLLSQRLKIIKETETAKTDEINFKMIQGKLQYPLIPLNGYFPVCVSYALGPHLFYVQSLESKTKLEELMEQLQIKYQTKKSSALKMEQIKPGDIYASKFFDGKFYRVKVVRVINNKLISVFYCDYGYSASLTIQELNPLDSEFRQLPHQALRATLHGVKARLDNWTLEHCAIFKKMVLEKTFYSYWHKIERDALHQEEIILDLLLMDITPEQIRVDQELVRMGIAVEL